MEQVQKEGGETISNTIKEELQSSGDKSVILEIVESIIYSPINLILLAICGFLMYKLLFSGREKIEPVEPEDPLPPPLKKQDMTVVQLRQYNGLGPDGRVCVAVNGKIFDVTRGKAFYGPGGPYNAFAGRDASRGLATFTVEAPKGDEYDDLSDLGPMDMESIREWEMQFTEKYIYVGKLLKPGEEPTEYSDDEDSSNASKKDSPTETSSSSKSKDE